MAAGSRNVLGQLALFGGNVLWRVVGVAAGAIGYAAQAGYSLVEGVGTVNGALFVPELATAVGGLLPIRTH